MRYFSRLQLLFGAVCVALLCILVYEWLLPPTQAAVPFLASRTRIALAPLPLAGPSPPPNAFDAINDRPLFKPDRKPVTTAAETAAAPAPPPTVSLIGVIIDGQRQLAMLRVPESPLAVSASVGDEVQGWRVTAVYPDHVVLRLNTTEITVGLNANRPGDTAAGQGPMPGPVKPATPAAAGNNNNNEQQL